MAAQNSGAFDLMGRNPLFMVIFFVSFLIATALGILAGLGVGGGSLLLLWLTQVMQFEQSQARLMNLLFYIPAALIATLYRRKHQQIKIKAALPGIVTGCSAALVLSLLTRGMDTSTLKRLLGGLLILIGCREVFYREQKAK